MNPDFHYATVTEALEDLRKKGYVVDFNLKENYIKCESGQFGVEEFEIKEVYRYEENTDPADEATVYGIESANGIKGVLVTSFGAYSDSISDEMLRKFK